MNDHEDNEPDLDQVPAFDDPTADAVRGLLADAAVDQPLPSTVAARLDETLAALVDERSAVSDAAAEDVVRLRPRAPFARRLLVAAAAVVLVGGGAVGLNQFLKDRTVSTASDATGATGTTAGATAERPTAGQAESAPAPDTAAGGKASPYADEVRGSVALTSTGFRRQAAALVGIVTPLSSSFDGGSTSPELRDRSELLSEKDGDGAGQFNLNRLEAAAKVAPSCPGPQVSTGTRLFSITFDGRPATLAVGPVTNRTQYVAAWSCDGSTLLASVNLTR